MKKTGKGVEKDEQEEEKVPYNEMIPGSPKRKRSGRGNYFIAISQYHQDFDK